MLEFIGSLVVLWLGISFIIAVVRVIRKESNKFDSEKFFKQFEQVLKNDPFPLYSFETSNGETFFVEPETDLDKLTIQQKVTIIDAIFKEPNPVYEEIYEKIFGVPRQVLPKQVKMIQAKRDILNWMNTENDPQDFMHKYPYNEEALEVLNNDLLNDNNSLSEKQFDRLVSLQNKIQVGLWNEEDFGFANQK